MTGRPKALLEFPFDGKVARIMLSAPKANILDEAMIADVDAAARQLALRADLHAIVIAAAGPHFSFGASVEEHLPERIGPTLGALHGLLRRLIDLPAPTIGAIQGQCLGGGFELALACDLLIVEQHAQLGCPEIKLGVFPPAASVLLPVRVGASRAASLCLIGETITGADAAAMGLAARVAADGDLASSLDAWLAMSFASRSATGLRFAAAAARHDVRRAMDEALPAAERLYLEGLMAQPDAVEGIRAFLQKRPPAWTVTV